MTENQSLGKDANIVANASNANYFKQWRLLASAQYLLIEANVTSKRSGNVHRTRLCHAVRAFNADSISIKIPHEASEQKATISGVQTCGNVWSCPICAKRIAIQRGYEIKHTIHEMDSSGFVPIMITLTARHNHHMTLSDFKDKFKTAWRKMSQDGSYNRLKKRLNIKHSIKANEVTYGKRNGWHYHSHGLLFLPVDMLKKLSDGELKTWTDELKKVWLRCLTDSGLDGTWERALDVKAHGQIKETYLAKLGLLDDTSNLNYELSSTHTKNYKGMNIWKILERATDGIAHYQKLYIEYVQAMTGDNWITFSHGLKALVGLTDKQDEELAAVDDESAYYELLTTLTDAQYAVIRKYRAYDDLLQVAAFHRSRDAVMNFIDGLKALYVGQDFEADIVRMENQLAYLESEKWELAKTARMNPRSKFARERFERHMLKIKTLSETLDEYKMGNMPF